MRRLVCLIVGVCALFGSAEAANRTVCASGCQYTSLQPALDAAALGDTILLRAGETFVGNYVFRAKPGSSSAYITVRSDAPDSSLPAAGVRLVPPGKGGANVSSSALPRLLGRGGDWKSTPVIHFDPGAHHYRLQFLDIDGTANLGYETLVQIGVNNSAQTSAAAAPYSIVLDRVYVHGHASKGMKRGISLNSRITEVLNSYVSDIMNVSDAQAIGGFNGAGPYRIINNYLEATGENVMFGGSDPRTPGLVPSDIELRRNHIYKKPSWRNAIMAAPSSISARAAAGGGLGAGTHYFKVAAVMVMAGSEAYSAGSTEAAATVSANGAVTLSWSAISGADRYRIYRGTTAGGETVYRDTTTAATSFTYTTSGEMSGAPRTTGTKWTVKNLIELKNAQRVTIDGNLIENNWYGFQNGFSILFTPKNQEGTAPWSTVQQIAFTNNTVRHVSGGINIAGSDYEAQSQTANDIRIANNVFDDVSSDYGNTGGFMLISSAPRNLVVDHNTIRQTGTIVEIDGPAVTGFVFTNNAAPHNEYGIKAQGRAYGLDTLNFNFPGWVFEGNALAGGPPGMYPAGNIFPSVAQFNASFVNAGAGDFMVVPGSPLRAAGPGGSDIGIDAAAFDAASLDPSTSDPGEDEPPVSNPPDDGTVTSPPLGQLPTDWQSADIGAVVLPGEAGQAAGVFTVRGSGADIWGTADAFQYAYTPLTGDGTITARVTSLVGGDPWSKVGVMIRASLAANAQQGLMTVSAEKGTAFQRRTATGAASVNTTGPGGSAPRWVRLSRTGNTIRAFASSDGASWTLVDTAVFTMPSTVLVGLAVTNHSTAGIATGVFDNVDITVPEGLPDGWQARDIGEVGRSGSTSAAGGTFTVSGAGADVWGTRDALQFVSRTLDGDGEIVARVSSVTGNQAWTKAGVMMRMTLDAGSAQAFMLVSAGKGIAFQRRTMAGGDSTSTTSIAGSAPRWVRLTRQGQTITAYSSTNGTSWTQIGRDVLSIVGSVEVGLAVSSHDAAGLATATFDSVTVR